MNLINIHCLISDNFIFDQSNNVHNKIKRYKFITKKLYNNMRKKNVGLIINFVQELKLLLPIIIINSKHLVDKTSYIKIIISYLSIFLYKTFKTPKTRHTSLLAVAFSV